MSFKDKVIAVVKAADKEVLLQGLKRSVVFAKAINSTKEYNHKDKVDKGLTGAATVIDMAIDVVRILK